MNKIQKLSRFFKAAFWIIFWSWPICLALIWFGDQHQGLFGALGLDIQRFIPNSNLPIITRLSLATKWQGFIVSFLYVGIDMLILYFFTRLFTHYERGEVFTKKSIHYLKKIGVWMFVSAAVNPFYQLAISLILTLHNPHGYREMTLSIGTDYIRNLIIAGLVFLIAYIMQEALQLHEEQALVV